MVTEGNRIKIFNGKAVIRDRIMNNVTIVVKDGIIERIAEGKLDFFTEKEVDANGKYIIPGLIDLQINGFSGIDFADQELTIEGIRKAAKALWKMGVTTFLPTLITNELKSLKRSLSILAGALGDEVVGQSIPGFHLEGPYISPLQGYRGAHLEKYIRLPDWDEFLTLQESAKNGIKVITVAPELTGAISFIRKCKEAGVAVALGHHNATSDIIKKAVDAGATMSTHLGNGCANLIDRHENPFWPQLANDGLTITIIVDGAHLNQEEVQCFFKMKGVDRAILVSDALDLAGLPPGEYIRGERKVLLTSEVVKFPEENCLAGAATPVSQCVMNMMNYTHCSLENAIQMTSANPARLLGINEIGEIEAGKRADLILASIADNKMIIHQTLVAGREVSANNDIKIF